MKYFNGTVFCHDELIVQSVFIYETSDLKLQTQESFTEEDYHDYTLCGSLCSLERTDTGFSSIVHYVESILNFLFHCLVNLTVCS